MKLYNFINLTILFVIFSYNAVFSYPIDLTSLPVYVKKGFDKNNCNLPQEQITLEEFYEVAPNIGNRRIQITDLPLDLPKRKFFEFRSYPKEDFTFLIYLNITKEDFKKIISPTFHFAEIGESWEIYFNNVQVDFKLSEKALNQKDVIVPIPRDLIILGNNILCIHIKGDPLSKETGFYYGKPYYFDELATVYKNTRNYLLIFLITVYTTMGIFNLLFFIKNLQEKYYFYFSLFSLIIAFYIFIRSSLVNEFFFIKNAHIIFRLESISLFLTIPFFSRFLESIIRNLKKWAKIFLYVSFYHGIILALIAIFLPINAMYDLLLIWQVSVPILIILNVSIIFISFFNQFNFYRKKLSFINSLFITILSTVQGNLLVGTIFIAILTLLDIYLNINKKISPGLSNYGILLFLFGASLRIIYNLMNLLNQVEVLNKRLKLNISQLKNAYNQIQISEEKYRFIFNNTSDILIIIKEDFTIINISDSFNNILNLNKNQFIGKNFFELIYHDADRTQNKNLIEERIKNFIYFSSDSLKMQLPLKCYGDIPFKYFELNFEKIANLELNINEILIRATPIKKNPLLKFLEKEYIRFILNTDIYIIDNVVSKLTEDLHEFFDDMELSMIRIGLREMLINAIEHGNLEISNEDKTRYLEQGVYHIVLKDRLSNPYYANKKVTVEQKFTLKEVIYKISDEGNGFDVKKYYNQENPNLSSSIHGRGIFITKNAFDTVKYNKKGNVVVLIKKINLNKQYEN